MTYALAREASTVDFVRQSSRNFRVTRFCSTYRASPSSIATMTAWTEPASLPNDAEAWAWLTDRLPQLAPLHLRAAVLRRRPLAKRQQPWHDVMADLDALPLPADMRRFAVDVLARAGRCETFLSAGQKTI